MSKPIRILGKKKARPIHVPSNNLVPRLTYDNTLMQLNNRGSWLYYFGYGLVVKIYKGDKFDAAYVNFGGGYKDIKNNFVLVFNNLNARKQLYTLKVGQYAQFGLARHIQGAIKFPNYYLVEWAMGIYVPKMVDIRNTELTENEIETMVDSDIESGKTFLDLFTKNE